MLEPAAMVVFTIPPSQGCQPDCEGFSVHRTESGSTSKPRFVRFGDVCTALGGGAKAWDMGAKMHELCRTAGFPVTNKVVWHCTARSGFTLQTLAALASTLNIPWYL